MAHTFFCAMCGKRFDVDPALIGRKAKCRQCQHVFVIPALDFPAPPAEADARRPDPVAGPGPRPRRTSPIGSRPAPPPLSRPRTHAPPAADPSGLDDVASPPLPPRQASPPLDDDEFLPRRPGKPTAGTKTRRRSSGGEFLWTSTLARRSLIGGGIGLLIQLLVWALGFTLFAQVIAGVIFVLAFGLMLTSYAIVSLVIPFRESFLVGLFCHIVPFYFIFFMKDHWESVKRPMLLGVCNYGIFSVAGLLLIGPIISGELRDAREASLRIEQRAAALASGNARPRLPAAPDPAPDSDSDDGDSPSVDQALEDLRSPDATRREAAIEVLKTRKDPSTAPALAKLLATPSSAEAVEALRALGPEAEAAVLPYLRHRNFFARREACKVLQVIGTAVSVPELRVIAGNHGPARQAARDALARIDGRVGPSDLPEGNAPTEVPRVNGSFDIR